MHVERVTSENSNHALDLIEEYYQVANVMARDSREALLRYIAGPASAIWIAVCDSFPAGCILYRPLPHLPAAGELKRLYVRPPFRRHGVAAKLLAAAEEFARASQMSSLYLDTAAEFREAIAFYRRHDYAICERYNDNPQATIFMRKQLSAMPHDSTPFREPDYIQSPVALNPIVDRTKALGFDMASEPLTGALLCALAAAKPAGRFLELGTGTGIATAWLLNGMDARSQLTSVDTDSNVQAVARELLGGDRRLTLVLEDGLHFLRHEPGESYDFVFADAMPGKYDGLEECLRVVKPGGFYIVDDLLPQPNWPAGHAEKIPLLIQHLVDDKRFTIAPLAWASGLLIAVRTSQCR